MNDQNLHILNSNHLEFPRDVGSMNFNDFVESSFSNFLNTILLFEGELGKSITARYSEIEQNCFLIKECINLLSVDSNNNNIPFSLLSPLYQALLDHHKLLSEKFMENSLNNWYRIRSSPENNVTNRSDIFHIPFHILKKADNKNLFSNRFSDGSRPMLYLANSMYLAWKECKSPDIKNVYAARFELDEQLNNLFIPANSNAYYSPFNFIKHMNRSLPNLNIKLNKVQNSPYKTETGVEELTNFMAIWPILFALSIPNNGKNENKEYLFPQYFMKWVLSNSFDGIAFATSQRSKEMSTQDWEINLVIPAVKESTNKYCEKLSKTIKLTNPIRIQDKINYIPMNIQLTNKRMQIPNETNYSSTIYCKAEYFLDDDNNIKYLE